MTVSKLLTTISALLALSAFSAVQANTFVDDAGAIRGYDTVAYHTESRPIKGNLTYTHEYNDVTWRFSSEENLRLFRGDPERYVPQYGGHCAYAMSKGHLAPSDPAAWTIVDEKLYLNFSLGVRKKWLKDIPGYVAKANANWHDKISRLSF